MRNPIRRIGNPVKRLSHLVARVVRKVAPTVADRIEKVLEKDAKVRDLVKATLPLWLFTVAASGAGWLITNHQQACNRAGSRDGVRDFGFAWADRLSLEFPDEEIVLDLREIVDEQFPELSC